MPKLNDKQREAVLRAKQGDIQPLISMIQQLTMKTRNLHDYHKRKPSNWTYSVVEHYLSILEQLIAEYRQIVRPNSKRSINDA